MPRFSSKIPGFISYVIQRNKNSLQRIVEPLVRRHESFLQYGIHLYGRCKRMNRQLPDPGSSQRRHLLPAASGAEQFPQRKPKTTKAPTGFFQALWRHYPWVIWSGIWTLLLVLAAIAVNNLVDPDLSSQQTPAPPETPGLSPPIPAPSPELNSPLWLFFALVLSCGAGSLALSQQLSRRAAIDRKQRLKRQPGEAIAPYFPEFNDTSNMERFVQPPPPPLPPAPNPPGLPPAYGLRRSDRMALPPERRPVLPPNIHAAFPSENRQPFPTEQRPMAPPAYQPGYPPTPAAAAPPATPPMLPAESRPPFTMPQESRLRDLDRHAPGLAELLNIQQRRQQRMPPPERPRASSE